MNECMNMNVTAKLQINSTTTEEGKLISVILLSTTQLKDKFNSVKEAFTFGNPSKQEQRGLKQKRKKNANTSAASKMKCNIM